MTLHTEEYIQSVYQDLGELNEENNIHLKRNRETGIICVEKHLMSESLPIYEFLKSHPGSHTPQIYECFMTETYLLIIEEYVEGSTLEELVEESLFSEEEALSILAELCDALSPLHEADPVIICRDLKAENIMMDKAGEIKIVDFDIAREYQPGKTRDTRLLGTKEYAAPEQFGFGQTDARTDIYALGVLLNYLISGKFPAEQMLPGNIGGIVKKCCRMDPDQRYQNVRELKDALTKGAPAVHDPHKDSFLPPGFRTRTWWKMILASCVYIVLAVFIFKLELSGSVSLSAGWQLFEKAVLFISQLLTIGVICDYRGIRGRLPLLKSEHLLLRIIGGIFTEAVLFTEAAVFAAIIETLFIG